MKLRIFLATGAALALASCGKSANTTGAADEATATATTAEVSPASAASAAAPAVGGAPTRDYIIGKWAMTGDDCSATIEYRADGAMVGPGGTDTEHWQLKGVELTNTIFPGALIVSVVDQKHMNVHMADSKDPPKRVTRC